MTEDGIAWRTAASGSLILHTSPDCRALEINAEAVREVSLDAYPESWRTWCTRCGPPEADKPVSLAKSQ